MEQYELKFKDGLRTGVPIFIGYFPMAMAFGLLAKAGNISFLATISFSIIVFAGASQFVAINLLWAGVAAGEIILATFLLNFRHLLMSASLAPRLTKKKHHWLPLVAFGVTDETFSVASTMPEKLNLNFMLGLELISYSGWVSGTMAGFLIGSSLPASIQASMGITLYAMFVAILIPQFKQSVRVIILTIGSGVIHTILVALKIFPSGWNLIIAMVIMALIGAIIFREDGGEQS